MSSTFSAAVNLAKYCIGAGILALPSATFKGGIVFSPLMIAVIAAWNSLASSMMVDCKNACRNIAFPADLSSTYSKIAYAGSGPFGVLITDFSVIGTLIGVCIAFQITFAQLLVDIPGNAFTAPALTILSGVIAYPISCTRDLDSLSSISLVGMVCLVIGIVAIIVYGLELYGQDAWENPLSYTYTPTPLNVETTTLDSSISVESSMGTRSADGELTQHDYEQQSEQMLIPLFPRSVADALQFVGVTIFCFDICSLTFPIEESMRNKENFSKAAIWSLTFVWLLYAVLGDLGAILYVHSEQGIRDNILNNLPSDSYVSLLVKISMASVSLMTYPLTLAPAARMIEHRIILEENSRKRQSRTSHHNACSCSRLRSIDTENKAQTKTSTGTTTSRGESNPAVTPRSAAIEMLTCEDNDYRDDEEHVDQSDADAGTSLRHGLNTGLANNNNNNNSNSDWVVCAEASSAGNAELLRRLMRMHNRSGSAYELLQSDFEQPNFADRSIGDGTSFGVDADSENTHDLIMDDPLATTLERKLESAMRQQQQRLNAQVQQGQGDGQGQHRLDYGSISLPHDIGDMNRIREASCAESIDGSASDLSAIENGTSRSRAHAQAAAAVKQASTHDAPLSVRCTHRLVLVTLTTLIASCIPCFVDVLSLLGSFTVAILCFVLPPYLHWRIVSSRRHVPIHGQGHRQGRLGSDGGGLGISRREDGEPLLSGSSNKQLGSASAVAVATGAGSWTPMERRDIGLTIVGIALSTFATCCTAYRIGSKFMSGQSC